MNPQPVSVQDETTSASAAVSAPAAQPAMVERAAATEQPTNGDAPPVRKKRKRPVQSILGTTVTLEDFMVDAEAVQFDRRERERVVDQALVLIEQLYVHLPLKRAMHAVDPVQRLKLLRRRVGSITEVQFSREMLTIFTELRDLHTNYVLPEPFRDHSAILPFLMEEFYEDGARKYMVSHVAAGFRHAWFKQGAVVTHWNGLPIDRAVDLNAEQQMGSNPDARHARGLEAMTIRPLFLTVPPDEEWVMVRYLTKGEPHEIQFRWRVIIPTPSPDGVDPDDAEALAAFGLGYDALTETARRVKKSLFAPKAVAEEKRMSELGADPSPDPKALARDLKKHSTMPDVFSFRTLETPHGTFGYIRLWTFMVSSAEAFILEFMRILSLLPKTGLVIDLRANGGGLISAGELMLQLLSPRPVEPSRLHFINSALTLALCERTNWLSQWKDSIEQSVEIGTAYSYGFPLYPSEEYNTVGQVYHGPVVLIVDPLCYSTTDIVAAGFQDHNMGKILGTSGNMGAGGANVWTHEILRQLLPPSVSPLRELPNRASFRIAIRRNTRVGDHSGVPLEGLGVIPDEIHHMTSNDLLNKNEDLLNAAAKLLAGMPVRELDAEIASAENGALHLEINTRNLNRLDVYVGGRPQASLDIGDGATAYTVPAEAAVGEIELRGFSDGELVARRRIFQEEDE